MSLFSDIANAIGHTVDSLAQAVGTDISILETVVNDLDGNGIDVFSAAAKLGLSAEGFLRGIVDLLNSDPHQLLLQRLTGRIKPMQDPLYQLSQHWMQVANLHQSTAQTLDTHINELFQGSGTESYSGPAADSLWATHQDYQQHFTVLVDHAQTQQVRHTTLGGHVDDYLSQAPGKVYSLSAPVAAFAVLSLDTTTADVAVLDEPAVQVIETVIEGTAAGGAAGLPEDAPIWPWILLVLVILVIILIIVILFFVIRDAIQSHQNQQKSTPPPTNSKKVTGPENSLTPAQEGLAQKLYNDYKGSGLSLDDIRKIIEDNPNLTEAQLRELLNQYTKVISANPNLVKKYGALAVFKEFIALAAYDAAHGGNYALRQPVVNMPNLQPGIEEAMAEMGVMEDGQVPWPLTPSQDPTYDVLDPTGQKWDEKSYRSVDTNGNPYNAANTAQKLGKDINKGEKIIFDDSQLTQQEIDDTYKELKSRGTDKDVIWWPTKPTGL